MISTARTQHRFIVIARFTYVRVIKSFRGCYTRMLNARYDREIMY